MWCARCYPAFGRIGVLMSEELIEVMRELINTLEATNRLLRADQQRRLGEREAAAQWSAEQRRALQGQNQDESAAELQRQS